MQRFDSVYYKEDHIILVQTLYYSMCPSTKLSASPLRGPSEKNGSMATPPTKNVKILAKHLLDANKSFQFWTSFRRSSLNEWIDNDQTYTHSDIIDLLKQMQNSSFETRQPIIRACEKI